MGACHPNGFILVFGSDPIKSLRMSDSDLVIGEETANLAIFANKTTTAQVPNFYF